MNRLKIPTLAPRDYQLPVLEYWDTPNTAQRAVEVWGRRLGKDLTYMNVACMKSFDRKGLYLHMLPEFAHARRSIWDGMTNEGDRLIDVAFPEAIRKSVNEQEMRIELVNGSVWQLGGSDQYNRWLGSNPIFITFSEFAIANPKGWELMRPILMMNGGSAAFITTPRGYNHAHQMLETAKRTPGWRWSHISSLAAGYMTQAQYEQEIADGMPEELARQEYLCDFSASNVGAILGSRIEAAEREGRLVDNLFDPTNPEVIVSSDIGFRDTATWWFWQRVPGGFHLVDYDEDTGLDADDWVERLRDKPYNITHLWLPHDARVKTFQSKRSAMETFLKAQIAEQVGIVEAMRAQDKVNAARSILSRCKFDRVKCAQGLLGLREWSFKWDDDRKVYSREPDHNWASHPADGFAYGASKLDMLPVERARAKQQPAAAAESFTLERLFIDRERFGSRERIG